MRIIPKSIIALFCATCVTSSLAATIVNHSDKLMAVGYTMCDSNKTMCTLINMHDMKASDHLAILSPLGPKLEHLTITSAVAKDSQGNKSASLNGTCDLPTNTSVVYLAEEGSSQIVCKFAQ